MVRTFDAPEALGTRFYEVQRALGDQQGARSARGCRSATRSIRTEGAPMRVSIALPAPPTPTSTSTPARTSSARSSSRSTRPSWCAPSSARPSWKGEHVALGTNTDPYQWVEGRYRLMEGIWEAMRDFANPCSVLTKSPLLLRDLELMKEIAERTEFTANLSIPTLDEEAWRATEPHTPHPRKRIEAVAELKRAGIRDRRPDRAADPRGQRLAGTGRAATRASGGGRGRTRSEASLCTCAARCGRSGSTGCASTART